MNTAKCPLCGKQHQIISVLEYIKVIVCNLITDLIYLNGLTVDKNSRELIKKELGL